MEFKLKYLELKTNIKKEILPAYTIIGDDDYLIFNAIKIIKKQLITNNPEFNYDSFDEENYDCEKIITTAWQMPFMAERRCIIIFAPKRFKEDKEKFTKYLSSPNPTTTLIFIDRQNQCNLGEVIDCNKLTTQELLKLVPNMLENNGKKIMLEPATMLIERCENNAMRLSKEIEKLSSYSDNELITMEEVSLLVKADLQFEVFKLINFIATKNKNQSISQINALIESKEDSNGVISLLCSTFRRMFYAKISNLPNQELAQKLGVKPFAISKAKENAEHFSQKQLKKILEMCENLDFMTKQGQISPNNALYYLAFNIFSM